MTIREMQQAEAEFQAATEVQVRRASKRRGATKAQLTHRAQIFNLCVSCGRSFSGHSIAQLTDCSNSRS